MTEIEVWVGGTVTLVAALAFVQVSVKPTENALDDPSGLVEEAAVRLLSPGHPRGDHCVTLGGD